MTICNIDMVTYALDGLGIILKYSLSLTESARADVLVPCEVPSCYAYYLEP